MALGWAPIQRSTTLPPLNRSRVGMFITPCRSDVSPPSAPSRFAGRQHRRDKGPGQPVGPPWTPPRAAGVPGGEFRRMIPLRDQNPSRSTPVVTRGLIVLNVAMFIYELWLGPDLRDFLFSWGLVPARLPAALEVGGESLGWTGLTFVSSLFLHGGWAHLIGNMWYLWIFGDNVEDQFGALPFLLFYVAAGVAASALHVFSDLGS